VSKQSGHPSFGQVQGKIVGDLPQWLKMKRLEKMS
jgi:hypothetical protein